MHNLSLESYSFQAENTMPWLDHSDSALKRQAVIQSILSEKAGAVFSTNCFVAEDAKVFTWRLLLGSNSWIASGAIIRGDVSIGDNSSVNAYAHIAGHVVIGDSCMVASLASIYGFNHGHSRADIHMREQPQTSQGVKLGDNVWVGANAVILDGVEIGSHSIVAAGAVVTHSVQEFSVVGGNPARVIAMRKSGL